MSTVPTSTPSQTPTQTPTTMSTPPTPVVPTTAAAAALGAGPATLGPSAHINTTHKTTPSPHYASSNSLIRLIKRKIYQYEVTYSLYMLTPMEKLIFNTFLFAFLGMLILAASLYLPQHIATIASRGWFYLLGDDEEYAAAASAAAAKLSRNLGSSLTEAGGVVGTTATEVIRKAAETVVGREL